MARERDLPAEDARREDLRIVVALPPRRTVEVSLVVEHRRQVEEQLADARMIGAQGRADDGERALVLGLRLVPAPRLGREAGQVPRTISYRPTRSRGDSSDDVASSGA
jgi:hypothetical protein